MKPYLLLPSLVATAFMAPVFAEQPAPPAQIQALLEAPTISLAPQNLRPGDQAVLVVISRFQRGQSKPIELKQFAEDAPIEAIELFHHADFALEQNPDSNQIRVYRITLRTKAYAFAASDFINLPPDFKLPELKIYRE